MSTGIFTTAVLTQDLAKKSFAGMITRLMPNGMAPLFGLTSMLPTETAVQTEHGFFTKTMLLPQVTLNQGAGILAADTVWTVTSSANMLPGMILRVDAGSFENVIVNTVISPTQITVTRAVGTVAAAGFADGTNCYQIGTAYEESSIRPNALIINPVRITNYTQIFRNTWAISDTVRQTMMIAGDTNVAESRMDCAAFHAADIEKAIFFGQKSNGVRNGQPFRTMDGLINIVNTLGNYPSYYAATNVFTAGGTTTYPQLEGFLDPVFNQTTDPKVGNQRILFAGGTARKVITGIARLATGSFYEITAGQTEWGLQYSTFKTSRGTFQIIEHPLFNSNASYSKMAVAVDLSTFRLAYLGDRKTQAKDFNQDGTNAVDNGIDAVGGTLTTECTTVVKNPPANSIVYNLTAAAAG